MSFWTRLFGPPSRDEFARLMQAALRRNGATGPAEYDPKEFTLRVGDGRSGGQHLLYLGNAYADYCRARRSDRREVVRRYAAIRDEVALADTPFDRARPNLLPRVVSRAYPAFARLQLMLQGAPPD